MHRLLILFISLLMLFSSTCTMKAMLWEQLGIEVPAPTKPYSSKGISFQSHAAASVAELCSSNMSSFFDEAEILPGSSLKAPLVLLSVLFILSLTLPELLQTKSNSNFSFHSSESGTVPIYLRLGQLIYYS